MTRSFCMGSGTALDRFPQPACAAFLGYEFVATATQTARLLDIPGQ